MPPNVLIILADDLGFSDVGAFGGEIQTPNIDKLAEEGLRLTDFHTASACSPTRAMLLSGTDHHVAGIGSMAERMPAEIEGKPGYEGYLNDRVAAFQEVMLDHGYATFMSGKWHLGLSADRVPPRARPQFEEGHENVPRLAANMRRMYYDDDKWLQPEDLPRDFYSSDSFTDILLGYLRDKREKNDERPWFAYLPFSAPHWPLQAPKESVDKYKGMYDDGPEALRQKRLGKLKEMGLVPESAVPAPVISVDEDGKETPVWEDMTPEDQRYSARKMEAYAGMVDRIDYNVGKLVDYLKSTGEYDNTVITFFSDNGAEGAQFEAWPITAGGDIQSHIDKYYDTSLENIGQYNSFVWYGSRWASASTAPGLLFKMFTSEGGIKVPFVMRYPGLNKVAPGGVDHSFCTVMDIMPTVLDLCGIPNPGSSFRDKEVAPMAGKSWMPYLQGEEDAIHSADHVTGWELFGRRAIRKGPWKGLFIPKPHGPNRWQLFNVLNDPGETSDLAEKNPERMKEMIELYNDYAQRNGVITQSTASRAAWNSNLTEVVK
ncbi:putative arylsulfatase [Xylariaceae sp. FL0016]|nr:putative arylsulfatase [Xylariaceae sp. FL0016]